MMHDAYGKYLIGDFNGKEFTPEQPMRRFEYGESFYASQTFSNVPEEDGRRIQIGWFRTATPYMPFNQSMGFPVERSEEHTSELQSRGHLVCRLLLEKKKPNLVHGV